MLFFSTLYQYIRFWCFIWNEIKSCSAGLNKSWQGLCVKVFSFWIYNNYRKINLHQRIIANWNSGKTVKSMFQQPLNIFFKMQLMLSHVTTSVTWQETQQCGQDLITPVMAESGKPTVSQESFLNLILNSELTIYLLITKVLNYVTLS